MKGWWCALAAICVLALWSPPQATAQPLPVPAHIVIVLEENKPDSAILGSKSAPYINALAGSGANMTQSFAETHPSEPNYLALFSGNSFGLTSDACPVNAGAARASTPASMRRG
jgi:acid phosphatase